MTEEEKREFLAIDENVISATVLKKLYQLAKAHVKGETIDFEKLKEPGPKIDVTPARTSRKNTNAIGTN